MTHRPTRDEAWQLVTDWIQTDGLRKHALAVEAGMRAYARRFNGDEELWGITGLVHDLDWERYPTLDVHPRVELKLFRDLGWPEELAHAVEGHAEYLGVPRISDMDKALFAVDELTGLILACGYVRPSKDLRDVELKSVKKKWKDKLFAAGVHREDIERGAAELGVPLDEHIMVVLKAMQEIAPELGLAGERS